MNVHVKKGNIMGLARGSICWKDIGGVKKRMCDTDQGPKFQCPNIATKLLIEPNGDVIYACGVECFSILQENEEGMRAVRRLGTTSSGFEIYVVDENNELRGLSPRTISYEM